MNKHIPVMLNETIDALNVKSSGIYIDGTFGRGGHSAEIVKKLNEQGKLFVLDKDPQAISTALECYAKKSNVFVTAGSYTQVRELMEKHNLCGAVDGILLDLGVSSPQLDNAERGFSFMKSGFLDMRMDNGQGQSAAEWINQVPEKDLIKVLKEYGEERYSKRIARAIINAREVSAVEDTKHLAEIIKQAHPNWQKGKHPATKSFQAIRIVINDELGELRKVLTQLIDILKPGGRIAIISFHSLEDRIVKIFFNKLCKGDDFPLDLPVTDDQMNRKLKLVGKAIKATKDEILNNPRSRSAVLRVAEKL
ncbi:MAG: 16S rRNA (cytosine(1402)-N(4))-methyltransferase RsmH [Pseudomonadota bacterium]